MEDRPVSAATVPNSADNGMAATARPAESRAPVAYVLPEKPLFTLRPSRGWVPLNVRELWAYRELLFFLTLRDIQIRYKQTLLGATWAVIQPLGTMLIFWLLFGKLAGMPSDGIEYPLFALAGLLPWTFFSNAVTNSSNSLVGSANLVTKVYFPRMIIPGATVLAGMVDLAIAFGVLGVMMACYGRVPGWHALFLLPVLLVLLVFLATGVGMGLSALNVKYRDVRHAMPFVIQMWMFATPIIYPASIVPEKWRWVLFLNPLTGIVENFRAALYGGSGDINWTALATATAATGLLFVYSVFSFRRMETRFADIV